MLGLNPVGRSDKEIRHNAHIIGNILMGLIAFGVFMFCFGFDFMLPDGPMWSTIILWLASFLSGKFLEKMGIPPLLGMLVSGIILKNIPGDPLQGLPESWASHFRSFGLSLILLRSGLELDIPMIRKQGAIAARLTVMPGVCEAFTVSGIGLVVFKMPYALALSMGFILAAVSPAVVVSGMFDLHKRGYGVAKGIPSLVVAAASFDDVVAISGFAMCIGLAVDGGEDPILGAMHGPINLIGGGICGYIGGRLAGCTLLWDSKWKRSVVTIFIGLFFMFGAAMAHYNGGGALAGLVTGICASMCWQNGWNGPLSTGPSNSYHHEVEHHVAKLWDLIAQPLLFGVIGASVDFRELDIAIIPKSLLVVAVGMLVRVPVAFAVTAGKDFTFKERAFIGLSWIPKATVQAALGSVPLDLIREMMDEDDADFHKWERWGEEVLVTAVVAILLTAPIGLICISKLGPKWLAHTDVSGGKGGKHGEAISKTQSQEHLTGGVTLEPENWALMEEARRASPEVLANQARTHTSRFFHRMVEESKAIRKLLPAEKGRVPVNALSSPSPVKSALMAPASDCASADVDGEGLEREVSIRLNDDTGNIDVNESTLDKIREHLDIIDEGVEAVWRVIDEQGENFPTADLFITSGGHYQNIPTYQEISRKLTNILNDEAAAAAENEDDIDAVRRTSFNGFVPSRSHIELYHQPMRSFTGYKATPQEIELYKNSQSKLATQEI